MLKSKQWLLLIQGLVLLTLAAAVHAEQAPAMAGLRLSPGGHPAAESVFVPAYDEEQEPEIDNAWYGRTGAKKGISGTAASEDERFAAADTAVLARGFAHPWKKLLAAQREPYVLAGPGDIAGLSATKRLLIIPTGGLSGTAESVFFRAGLEEFTKTGGILFCLAQRSGRDYSALPAPQPRPVQAKGWAEDSGPLFRSSSIRANHPLLAGLSGNSPAVETEGYIAGAPPGSRILLARLDGYPTIIAYPFGKGWVVITTLFTDFSSLSGSVEADEQTIIRNLLAWSGKEDHAVPDSSPAAGSISSAPESKAGDTSPSTAPPANGSRPLLDVRASVESRNNMVKISFDVLPSPRFYNETLLVRTGGQEKTFTPSAKENVVLVFDIPRGKEKRIAYKFYRQSGRSILRGSIAVPENDAIGPAQATTLPGQSAAVRLAGLEQGELGLTGIGYFDTQVTSGTDTVHVPLPSGLPAGTYRMEWQLNHLKGRKQGEFGVDVAGTSVDVEDIVVASKAENGRSLTAASITMRANQKVSGTLRLALRGPQGEQVVLAEPVLSLAEGVQTVPVPFTFSPHYAGIWELICTFTVTIPEGAGLPREPAALAAGSALFDFGDAAVLSVAADKPIYYQAAGSVTITAAVFGAGRKIVKVLLDGKEIARENVELAGTTPYRHPLRPLEPGTHSIRVEAESDRGISSKELNLLNGFLLPDLIVNIKGDGPQAGEKGPEMPLSVQVTNQGRSQAASGRVVVYDGDPYRDGAVIEKVEVPALGPGERHSALIHWGLYRKAGKHTLFAQVDADNAVRESHEQNNSGSLETVVPELLLAAAHPEKSLFAADEPVSIPFSVFNLGGGTLDRIKLSTSVRDPSGRSLSPEAVAVDRIAPSSEKKIAPVFNLASPGIGAYSVSASIATEKERSSTQAGFSIGPTLSLKGSLEGTPAAAVLCRPFTIDYAIRNSGNILPSSGTITVEILRPEEKKPLFSRQLPLSIGKRTLGIESMDLPAGSFLIRLAAKAESEQHKVTREVTLSEQPLSIAGPIDAVRLGSSFPRILLWLGREGRRVEQAVSESIAKQAFDHQDVYYKVVESEEAFTTHAMTGLFNTYVLFEPEESLRTDWLKQRLERGQGVIIIGSGATAQAVLGEFGFSLEAPAKQTTALTFSADSGLDLSGTMPVSGQMLSPRKRGTATAAVYVPGGQPAVVMEKTGKGKLIAMPLSVSRSASTGATAQYSLALRKIVHFLTPEKDDTEGAAWGGLAVSSKGGPVRARIKETFPEGTEVLWSNLEGKRVRNAVTFDLHPDREARKLLYLYRTPASGAKPPQTEISYECGGTFVDQGKVE